MSATLRNNSDAYLWLGFGIFLFAAAKGIQHALTELVSLTELDPDQFPELSAREEAPPRPEDSIPLSTLETLLKSPNPSIALAAQDIIVQRVVTTLDPKDALVKDLESGDEEKSRRAMLVAQFLLDWDGESVPQNSIFDAVAEAQARSRGGSGSRGDQGGVVARLEELNEELARDVDIGSRGDARFAGWDMVPHQRPSLPGGSDEVERRRRRREAMVLHEGEGRVGDEDIFRPVGR